MQPREPTRAELTKGRRRDEPGCEFGDAGRGKFKITREMIPAQLSIERRQRRSRR